jgi:branched-chain amino acid transport system permease protein
MATRYGLALRALHDDELVATLMAVPARAMQVTSFAIGAGLAGLAGGLYAHHFSFVEAQYFSPLLSIYVLLFVLIGGTQTAWGPLIGATFFTLVPELLRVGGSWRYVAFGVLIVAMMMFRPEGIVTRSLVARLFGRRSADA